MSFEMNTMVMAMPAMPHGPIEVRVHCFEATAANISTLRRLAASTASAPTSVPAGSATISAKALMSAGMKAKAVTASLSTTVKAIRADLVHGEGNAPVADDGHTTLFAVAQTSAADPLISLVDDLTVGEMLECPQIAAWQRDVSAEVCVGASGDEDASSSTSPSLVLFYARDASLGCSGCCLGACLGAMCATLCCCCVCCSE